jgi:aspartate-semialdehyde dehydrogenase
MALRIAVVGATGTVGRQILNVLAERRFPAREVAALASRKSQGKDVSFGGRTLKCQALENFEFRGVDMCLMAANAAVAGEWAPKLAVEGCVVVDVSPRWRMDREVPLVVPEVNRDALAGFASKNMVASPSPLAVQLSVALKPLHDFAPIRRIVVASYQSVSGAGRDAMDELFKQTKAIYVNDPVEPQAFPKQIAFNVIPQVGEFMASGFTEAEFQTMAELQKVLDPSIQTAVTCVRAPVFVGDGAVVNVEFERAIGAEQARGILRDAPGCQVVDKREDGGYVTPVDASGEDAVFVGRVRKDPSVEFGLSFWIMADNVRRGAALNAVMIAEALAGSHLTRTAV